MIAPPIVAEHPIVDQVLGAWDAALGRDAAAYRGHVYRVFHFARAIATSLAGAIGDDARDDVIAAASAFHDLGIWSDGTFDYLDPSVARARAWLADHPSFDADADADAVEAMIRLHHKLTPCLPEAGPLAEAFRRADLVDLSLGALRAGLPRAYVAEVRVAFPNAGFHLALGRIGGGWLLRHPLRPLPMMRW
jgi:hypothetical protein